ncbi:MAG: phage major capsid protein [Novosphingobium sp.]
MTKIDPPALAAPLALARDNELPMDTMTRDITFEVRAGSVNEEARTVELSFSSEEPYARWWGTEILDHKDASVRLGRLNNGAALLMDHNTRDQVGVVERAWVKGRKGHALVRFGKSARAEEIWQDVRDGIRKLVSVGYRILELILEKEKDGEATYRATDWEPYEISIVAVPADTTVGVGRDGEPAGFDPRTLIHEEEDEDMNMTRNAGGAAAAPAVAPAAAVAAPATPEIRAAVPPAPAGLDAETIRRQERDRCDNIRAMGTRLDCAELAEAAIRDGQSLEDFIRAYQDKAGPASALRTAEDPAIGLGAREQKRYSFLRLMNALANPNDRRAQEDAAFELECSAEARRRSQKTDQRGETVPLDVLRATIGAGQRDLTVGTAADGGDTVATDLLASNFIDLLRNAMVLEQLGIRRLGDLNGNIAIPRQTGGATAYWVAESGAPTESKQGFDQVALTPKTLGAFTDISRKLLLQSSIDVEAFVRQDLATIVGLAIDLAGIHGSGSSNQPTGVLATSGIGSVVGGTNGAAPDWDDIVDLETAVAQDNAAVGSLAYLTNTKVRGKLKKTEMFSGTNGLPIWEKGAEPLNGYRAAVSNQVSSTLTKGTASGVCSAIIFGNWADLILGMWGGLDLMVDPYTNSTSGTVRIVALQDVDVAVRHPESFAAMLDALTA